MKRQWFEDSSDVNLRAAGRTNVESTQAKVDEFLDKLKDLTARRGKPRKLWAFVDCIQNKEN